jgi:hypothetical protein
MPACIPALLIGRFLDLLAAIVSEAQAPILVLVGIIRAVIDIIVSRWLNMAEIQGIDLIS